MYCACLIVPLHTENLKSTKTMSTATLTSLLDYLYGTLTPSNMRWVAEHLTEYANKQEHVDSPQRYTQAELNAMLDMAEADIAAGRTIPHEESMRRWKEKLANEENALEMAEAV